MAFKVGRLSQECARNVQFAKLAKISVVNYDANTLNNKKDVRVCCVHWEFLTHLLIGPYSKDLEALSNDTTEWCPSLL